MSYYDFKKDLPVAKKSEREVAAILIELYDANILEYGDTNKYDILAIIKGKDFRFEVKEDFLCEQTGNVGLEFECRGKPSGIQVTEADLHVHKIHTKQGIIYVIHKTDILKRMIEEKKYFRIVNGGDKGSNSMNYLFKYKVFVETGRILPLTKNG